MMRSSLMYMRSSAEMARSSVNSAATCALTCSRNLAIVVPFLHCGNMRKASSEEAYG